MKARAKTSRKRDWVTRKMDDGDGLWPTLGDRLFIDGLMSEVEIVNGRTKEVLDRLPSDDIIVRELRAAALKAGDDAIQFFKRWQEIELEDVCAVDRDAIQEMAVTWHIAVQIWNGRVMTIARYITHPKKKDDDVVWAIFDRKTR